MRLRRRERSSVSAIDAKSDPFMWLPEKEESKMTSRRNVFKLIAGAVIAPKVAAELAPCTTEPMIIGFDPAYSHGGDMACTSYAFHDGHAWQFSFKCNPFEPQLDGSEKVSES